MDTSIPTSPPDKKPLYAMLLVALISLALLVVVGIKYLFPNQDNTPLILQLLGLVSLGAGVLVTNQKVGELKVAQQVTHDLVNSQMTKRIDQQDKTSHAAGKAEGLAISAVTSAELGEQIPASLVLLTVKVADLAEQVLRLTKERDESIAAKLATLAQLETKKES